MAHVLTPIIGCNINVGVNYLSHSLINYKAQYVIACGALPRDGSVLISILHHFLPLTRAVNFQLITMITEEIFLFGTKPNPQGSYQLGTNLVCRLSQLPFIHFVLFNKPLLYIFFLLGIFLCCTRKCFTPFFLSARFHLAHWSIMTR